MTTTARSLKELRRQGYQCDVVERWLPMPVDVNGRRLFELKVRKDFAGFADILAFRKDKRGVLAVQTTTADHLSHRLRKLLALPAAKTWMECGNRITVHGWKKVGNRWRVRRKKVGLEEFAKGLQP